MSSAARPGSLPSSRATWYWGISLKTGALDFTQAHEAFERALALAPGDATVLRLSGDFLVSMRRQFDEGISAARRAVALDPVNRSSHLFLGAGLYFARRYREVIQAYADRTTGQPSGAGSGIRQDWTAHRRGAEPRFQAIERQLKFPS